MSTKSTKNIIYTYLFKAEYLKSLTSEQVIKGYKYQFTRPFIPYILTGPPFYSGNLRSPVLPANNEYTVQKIQKTEKIQLNLHALTYRFVRNNFN